MNIIKELVEKIIVCDFDNIPLDDFPMNERFGLVVNKDNVKYEFLIEFNPNKDKIICVGSGAINNPENFKNSPRFHRQSWDFGYSTIYYNDPTRYLDDSLEGGWGIGTPDEWYLKVIKDIIIKITKFFNFKNEDILFYGSSLGGFMSIQLSIMVKGSKSLADVPQLTFENASYYKRIKSIIFPNMSDETILKKYKHRLNVLEFMKKEKYIPDSILIFDAGNVDINEHYVHFFKELNKITNLNKNLIKIVINPIDEHKYLDKEETICMVDEICKNNLLRFNKEIYSSDLYLSNHLLKEIAMQNKLKINNIIFTLPDDFHIKSKDSISDNDSTIYIKVESHDLTIESAIQKYKKYIIDNNGTPIYEKFNKNGIIVHKVSNATSKTSRYWFMKNNRLYQIFTYKKNEFTDMNIKYLINSIKNENKLIIKNSIFTLPDGFWIHGEDSISDHNSIIYIKLENYVENIKDNYIKKYIDYIENNNGTPTYTQLDVNNIPIHKITNTNSKTSRYWFMKNNRIYQIFTYKKNEFTDMNIKYLIKTLKII